MGDAQIRPGGARLHVRLVTWFSLIAVVPAILVAIFAAVTLNLGMESLFAGPVKSALGNAVEVAKRYTIEHENSIAGDATAIADAIQRDPTLWDENKKVCITTNSAKH